MAIRDPYAGFVFRRGEHGQLVPAATGPHVLVSGPTGIGKTRRVLAPAAVFWQGPAVVVSSKDDLMKLVEPHRWALDSDRPAQLIDLRPVRRPVYPESVLPVRTDPTVLVEDDDSALTLAELLIAIGTVGMGGASEDVTDGGLWDTQAAAPLAALILAASPAANSVLGDEPRGMKWLLEAVEDLDPVVPDAPLRPCWQVAASAAAALDAPQLSIRAQGVLMLDPRQRDSIKINVTKAVTAWVRRSIRRPDLPVFDPAILDRPGGTLYVLAPADGVAAAAAVSVIDSLIHRWREKESSERSDARLLLVIDELPNTAPLPKLATYIGEARGLGVNIVAAVQASSQFARKYGSLQLQELRDVFPATLVMHGAPEQEMLEAASFWAGQTERRSETYDQRSGGRTLTDSIGALTPAIDLAPTTREVARLLRRGTPGELVAVPDYSELIEDPSELDGRVQYYFQQAGHLGRQR